MDDAFQIPYFFNALLAAVLGLALLAVVKWRRRTWSIQKRDSTELLLAVVAWVLTLLGTLYVFVFLASALGFFLWLAMLVVLAMVVTRRRAGQRRTLLRLLAAATKAELPLAPAVAAFAQESPGAVGEQSLRLHEALDRGVPLPDALAQVRSLAPSRQRALVYVGLMTHDLAPALREAALEEESSEVNGEITGHLLYVSSVLVFGVSVLTFMMLKIVPAFKAIFQDFNTELPAITQLLITLSNLASALSPLIVLLILGLWGTFFYSLLAYVGWARWRVPFPGRWTRALDTSTVLRGLAVAVQSGRPLDQGIYAMGPEYPDAWIRHRLLLVGEDLNGGVSWWDSLRQRGLIGSADQSLLRAAQQVGNVPWALRAVADSHLERMTYRLRWWLHLVSPPVLSVVGMMVAFIVVALFVPLVKIIESLS